jgi:hypothetical protein
MSLFIIKFFKLLYLLSNKSTYIYKIIKYLKAYKKSY